MVKVFLAPGFLKHIKRSVIDGVRLQELDLQDRTLLDSIRAEYGSSPIKLWAVKETLVGYWERCEPGDLLLFYNGGIFRYSGEVAFRYPTTADPAQLQVSSRLAETVWGRDVDGRTWPYLIFLKNVREISLPLEEFNRATGYKFKAVAGFTLAKRAREEDILGFLRAPRSRVVAPSEPEHDQIVDIIYDLGQLIGYQPEKRWRYEGYEFDVAWFRKPRVGPKCVFEVQLRGSVEAALTKLKHAHDLWESTPFLISTPEQIEKLERKYLEGAFHELRDILVPVRIDEIEQFYEFKGKFEWLERKFGLKPS